MLARLPLGVVDVHVERAVGHVEGDRVTVSHEGDRAGVDGLGWTPELDVPGEVLMIKAGEHLVLSLWAESGFEGEVGPIRRGEGLVPVTIAHNVCTPAEVDEILELARSIGADPVSAGERRDWGGYTGYFADPDGYRWEIAVNEGMERLVIP